MITRHYDIAIVGSSVAAQISAALLAKQGGKVLFLHEAEATAPLWFHSSVFLEKLLGILGGRSCFVRQHPIQFISETSRLTVCHDVPLERELEREFGPAGLEISDWLSELNELGSRLEKLLWESGGLPWPSLKAVARFKLLCLLRKTKLAALSQPVSQQLTRFPGPVRTFLTDLLQGLSVMDVSQLSQARAAILWAQVQKPENLKEPDFRELIGKRFDQFHGARVPLHQLTGLEYEGNRWVAGQLASGAKFTAREFLLGNQQVRGLFAAGQHIDCCAEDPVRTWQTSNLAGQLSGLLANRIICGGKRPLRLALEDQEGHLRGLAVSAAWASESEVRAQLAPALPFAKYTLKADTPDRHQASMKGRRPRPLANRPIRISENLYWADQNVLFPEMGGAGAALLAWTLVNHLQTRGKTGKG